MGLTLIIALFVCAKLVANMSKITVIQILQKEPSDKDSQYKEIITNNSLFLNSVNVEYIVYDTLKSFEVLKFVKEIPKIKYFRKTFENTKKAMLDAGILANGEKVIYLKSEDSLTLQNVERLEKIRPNVFKKDLNKISNIKPDNFKYDDFQLLIKDKKTLWEKLKLIFAF